jgi:hypothetical protein
MSAQLGNRGSILGNATIFFSFPNFPNRFWGLLCTLFYLYRGLVPAGKAECYLFTTSGLAIDYICGTDEKYYICSSIRLFHFLNFYRFPQKVFALIKTRYELKHGIIKSQNYWAMCYIIRKWGFDFHKGQKALFSTASKPTLRLITSPI